MAQREEFRDNADPVAAGPGVIGTRAQARGFVTGALAGGVAGAVVGLALGLMPILGLGLGVRLAICGFVCAAAGATIGLVAGGGYGPQIAGETDVHGTDPELAGRARTPRR